MDMEFSEFRNQVLHKGNRNFKVKGSFGVYHAYKHIRKNGWYNIGRPVTEKEFYAIIRGINKLLAKEIGMGNTVTFPSRMGKLELRKSRRGAFLMDGKLKITYPIDWSETLKLWYEDGEALKNKTLKRKEQEYLYHVKYCVYDATYNNKMFYQFVLNHDIKKELSKNIREGKTDTLW